MQLLAESGGGVLWQEKFLDLVLANARSARGPEKLGGLVQEQAFGIRIFTARALATALKSAPIAPLLLMIFANAAPRQTAVLCEQFLGSVCPIGNSFFAQ